MDILVLTATAFEQEVLRRTIPHPTTRTFAHRERTEGKLGTRRVALIETGIGAVNTAQALTAALETERPDFVLQVGVGGAYAGSQLNVGDLAVATEENDGELGILAPDGWLSADRIGIPVLSRNLNHYNTFPLDAVLARRAATMILNVRPDATPAVRSGPFVTVQQCSGLAVRGNELAARFNAICENMEGAAAAHVCALYDVPFIELRGISNLVEDRDTAAWKLPLASGNAQGAARVLIENLAL
ncbi:MAG: futalosine hydrolase [Gemmatimonadota bacterium]|nr:futalosine hydrolase [Gemmatimonadota bacterium]